MKIGIESTCNRLCRLFPYSEPGPQLHGPQRRRNVYQPNDSFGASSSLFYPIISRFYHRTILVADNSTIYRLDETNGPIGPIAIDGTINYSNMTYYNRVPIIGGTSSCGASASSCTPTPGDDGLDLHLSMVTSMKIRHNGNLQVGFRDDYDSNTGEVSNERRIYEFEPEADGTWSFLDKNFASGIFLRKSRCPLPPRLTIASTWLLRRVAEFAESCRMELRM